MFAAENCRRLGKSASLTNFSRLGRIEAGRPCGFLDQSLNKSAQAVVRRSHDLPPETAAPQGMFISSLIVFRACPRQWQLCDHSASSRCLMKSGEQRGEVQPPTGTVDVRGDF